MASERLIDANALAEHIKDVPTWWGDEGGYYGGARKYPEGLYEPEDIISSIDNAPTVDAVPVVRCRECKYSYGNKYCTNDAWKDEGNTVYIEPDAFCSYGERRSDG